jgi:hypothetical protein
MSWCPADKSSGFEEEDEDASFEEDLVLDDLEWTTFEVGDNGDTSQSKDCINCGPIWFPLVPFGPLCLPILNSTCYQLCFDQKKERKKK